MLVRPVRGGIKAAYELCAAVGSSWDDLEASWASLELRPSVMKAACANANRFLSSANRRRSNSSSEIQPQWLVMADRQELVEMVRSMVPDRVVALDSSVRVHSGLQEGGEGRVGEGGAVRVSVCERVRVRARVGAATHCLSALLPALPSSLPSSFSARG